MYSLKAVQTDYEITHKPKCMYSLKSYYDDKNDKEKISSVDKTYSLKDLLNQQDIIINRLNELEIKVDKHLKKSNKTDQSSSDLIESILKYNLNKHQKFKVLNDQIVKDIVIQVDPKNIPYSLIVLAKTLCMNFKCFIKFYTHSTCIDEVKNNHACKSLEKSVKSLNLDVNESRFNYDYGITFLWKRIDHLNGPIMFISDQSGRLQDIYGEATIIRFLNALATKNENNYRLLIDNSIDNCTNHIENKKKEFLIKTDEKLLNKKSIIDQSVTIADLYLWSKLKQNIFGDFTIYKNINKWFKSFEANNLFDFLN